MNNFSRFNLPLNWSALCLILIVISCKQDDGSNAPTVPWMLSPSEDIQDVNYPADFSTCFPVHNFDTSVIGRLGWAHVVIDEVEYYGNAYYIDYPLGSDRYDIRIFLYNYNTCEGFFSLFFGDTGLSINDPHNGHTEYGFEFSACTIDGIRVQQELPRPGRAARLDYLNHDTSLQLLNPDEDGDRRVRLVLDQVDIERGFVRGRFGGRFTAGEECSDQLRPYGDEALVEYGYFEATAYRR